jgi:hypothetical protein
MGKKKETKWPSREFHMTFSGGAKEGVTTPFV